MPFIAPPVDVNDLTGWNAYTDAQKHEALTTAAFTASDYKFWRWAEQPAADHPSPTLRAVHKYLVAANVAIPNRGDHVTVEQSIAIGSKTMYAPDLRLRFNPGNSDFGTEAVPLAETAEWMALTQAEKDTLSAAGFTADSQRHYAITEQGVAYASGKTALTVQKHMYLSPRMLLNFVSAEESTTLSSLMTGGYIRETTVVPQSTVAAKVDPDFSTEAMRRASSNAWYRR